MEPVYARIAGHGVALVPRSPFVISRYEDGVAIRHGELEVILRVVPGDGGGTLRYRMGEGVEALRDVVDPVEIDYRGPLRIETTNFACEWPEGFALASADRDGPFLFDLVGEGDLADALLFVAGPYTAELCPDIGALVGPGQTERARGNTTSDDVTHEWLEVTYAHGDVDWTQRHHRFVQSDGDVLVLTAQAPSDAFEGARAAATRAAESLRIS